jgi:hypothetical protein
MWRRASALRWRCTRSASPHSSRRSPRTSTIEQTAPGTRAAGHLVASFDGLGVGFEVRRAARALRNPSDNSLAVGPDHVVQTVNSRMAIFTKKGKRFDASGKPLYGPVNTNNVFKGLAAPASQQQRRRGGPL